MNHKKKKQTCVAIMSTALGVTAMMSSMPVYAQNDQTSSKTVKRNAVQQTMLKAEEAFTGNMQAYNAISDALSEYEYSNSTTEEDIQAYLEKEFVETGKLGQIVNIKVIQHIKATKNTTGYIKISVNYMLCNSNIMYTISSFEMTYSRLLQEGEIAINKKNFPDKTFREYVRSNFDNDDGVLTKDEVEKATFIDVRNMNIETLEGIELLSSVQSLWCAGTKINDLNVKYNPKLRYLDVTSTNLSALDVSENIALERLTCSGTKIMTLDVSSNQALTYLYCNNNLELSKIIVTGALALQTLNCSYTGITDLNVSGNQNLLDLNCENTKISDLSLNKQINLTKLICANTNITHLDVSKNTALKELDCRNTPLAWLNLGTTNHLVTLNIPTPILNEDITTDTFHFTELFKGIEVANISNVEGALLQGDKVSEYVYGIPITYEYNCGKVDGKSVMMKVTLNHTSLPINEENFPDAEFREYVKAFDADKNNKLSDTEISKINKLFINKSNKHEAIESVQGIEYFPFLTELYCDGTKIKELDVSKNPSLIKLNCGETDISTLILKNNKALKELSINDTNIETINLSNNVNLEMINGAYSALKSLNVENNKKLEKLYCRETTIEELDISNNNALKYLDCANTLISKLEITNHPNLSVLYCEGSKKLNTLTFSAKTALKDLDCSNTILEHLDVREQSDLIYLYCYRTKIDKLDVSNNPELIELNCSNTEIEEIDVTNLPKLQNLWTWATKISYLDLRNNANLTHIDTPQTNLAYLDWGNINLIEAIYGSSSNFDIIVNRNSFDITKVFKGIDASKVEILSNGSIDEKGIVSGYDMDLPIVYTYTCGTVNNNPATLTVTLNIAMLDSSIEIEGDLDVEYTGQPINDPVVKTSGSKGNISYVYQVKTGDGWELMTDKPVTAGTYKVKAYLAGDATYKKAESKEREFVIKQAENRWVNQLSIKDWVYGAYDIQIHSPKASAAFGSPVYTYSNAIDGMFHKDIPNTAGTWFVKATIPETENYKKLEKVISFKIEKAPAPIVKLPENLTAVQDDSLSSITLQNGWSWMNHKEQVSVEKASYTASLAVDDVNYDYSQVAGYDAAKHCVIRELSIQVAQAENSWAIEPSMTNWTYGEKASTPKGEALHGDTFITYSNAKDGTFTSMLPTTAGTWYMKVSAPASKGYKAIEKIVAFEIQKAKAPVISLPDDLNAIHEEALETITLPQGWHWVNGKETVSVDIKEYLASYDVDDVNYDYSQVAGYDAANHWIEISIFVNVGQITNSWKEMPSISDWSYGEASKQPIGEAAYGDVIFTYSNAKDGVFTKEQPTQAGTWYMKASIVENKAYSGLDMISSFRIHRKLVEDNGSITVSDIHSASDVDKLIIKDGDKTLIKGVDYDVEKKATKNKVKVIINFKGNYTGMIARTYMEKPKDKEQVQTNDHSQTGFFALLGILSAGCITLLTGKKKKKKS